jgi:PAS domain S-box-containing protein
MSLREPFSSQPATRDSLLGSIQQNPQLQRQLERMPADEKTIELSSQRPDDFTHPDWRSHAVMFSPAETLEISPTVLASTPLNLGFVPLRQIANLGSGRRDDADYRFVGQLGAGGTGVIFQAHQRAVDREVAVKMLRHELASKPHSRERFLAEARVIGGLDHPNVIALHEVYADEHGSLFYSMKRIDGTSWDKQISELTLTQNIETLLRVADAIRYAHSRGLIHRDIKPENVMLGKFGEVLVADWGLAINYRDNRANLHASQSVGGTPAYMAPELASASAGSITFQSDVYLLGAILFQILTGKPPHQGETLWQDIVAAANNVIEPTEIDGELMEIAMRAMQTKPIDRFATVDEFIAAIKDQRQHEQSERLSRRALRQVKSISADSGDAYRDFGIADALLGEAIEIWPENLQAIEARKQLQLRFAAIATERGDYDLAANLYDAAGEGESEAAEMVQYHRIRRDTSQQQVSRYSVLFTQSPDAGLLVQMTSAKIVEANAAFERMFGYASDQVVGHRVDGLKLWVSPERQKLLVGKVRRHGTVDNFEAKLVRSDGQVMDVLINSQVVEVLGETMVLSTIRDISQRMKAENDLKRSQARLRDLQRMAGLATWSYRVATQEVVWNEELFELTGRDIEHGTPTREEYFEMVHPDDRASLHEAMETAIHSGAAFALSVRQRGANGEYFYVRACGQPIFDDEGKTIEVYGILMERSQREEPI